MLNIFIYFIQKKSLILQEIILSRWINKLVRIRKFDVHLNYGSFIMGLKASRKLRTVFDLSDDNIGIIKISSQIPIVIRPLAIIAGWIAG